MARMTPCLWFDGKAEEAARFYVSIFPRSSIDAVLASPLDTPGGKTGQVMLVNFTLDGMAFAALNGGPHFQHSPAVSFVVPCADQAEIDRIWNALAEGGQEMQCGWLTDRYGVAWQIVPAMMLAILEGDDGEMKRRAMAAMMTMVKFDIAAIEAACRG